MSEYLLGEMRIPPWQREIAERVLAGEKLQFIHQVRPRREDRVIGDALMVVASIFSDRKVVLVGPDEKYGAEVEAEVKRILGRLRE